MRASIAICLEGDKRSLGLVQHIQASAAEPVQEGGEERFAMRLLV